MKNKKTTLGGLLAAIGTALTASNDAVFHTVGVVITAVGSLLLGTMAKDHNVSGK